MLFFIVICHWRSNKNINSPNVVAVLSTMWAQKGFFFSTFSKLNSWPENSSGNNHATILLAVPDLFIIIHIKHWSCAFQPTCAGGGGTRWTNSGGSAYRGCTRAKFILFSFLFYFFIHSFTMNLLKSSFHWLLRMSMWPENMWHVCNPSVGPIFFFFFVDSLSDR